jgi:polyphosphate kinase 2 (PPK2 family)
LTGKAKNLRLCDPKKIKGIVLAEPGREICLAEIDPAETAGHAKSDSAKKIRRLREMLAELQEALYAEHQRSVLIVVQGMDTGGKDGAIKNLCLGLDPNGVQLTNFKYPTAEERDHDFLWRVHKAAPRKGRRALEPVALRRRARSFGARRNHEGNVA